jgi:hypothetical protein
VDAFAAALDAEDDAQGALPKRHARVTRTSSRRFVTFARERRTLGGLFSHDDSFGKLVHAIELHLGRR